MAALPYLPRTLLRNGHLQTLMVGLTCGWRPAYQARQIQVPLADGDQLVVHEEQGGSPATDAPLVILIHGLGGDHSSPYLQRLAYQLHRDGLRVWRVDLRGSGAGLTLAWRPPHAGSSRDVAAVVRVAQEMYPTAPIRLAGFSLSGNIVLKLLGEAAAGPLQDAVDLQRIQFALAVAPPVDLHQCATNMDRFSRSLYTKFYLRMLAEHVDVRRRQWPQWQGVPVQPKVRTIRQFDARYTAPLGGFRDTDHYYTDSSALTWLPHISTKTLVLIDRHDPIVDYHSFAGVAWNERTTQLVYTRHGGHMGYFGLDDIRRPIRWLEHFARQQMLRDWC